MPSRFPYCLSTFASASVLFSVLLAPPAAAQTERRFPTVSIQDAIGMVRIQPFLGPVAAFSPDGSRFVSAVWHGDLAHNTNVYDLLLFRMRDRRTGFSAPERLLSLRFPGDTFDHSATAIAQLAFLRDNRTIAFIGREGTDPAQVYLVDAETKRVRRVTRSPSDVTSYAIGPMGALRLYSRMVPSPDDSARVARLATDAVFLSDPSVYNPLLPPSWLKATGIAVHFARQRESIRQYLLVDDRGGSRAPIELFDTRALRSVAGTDATDNAARDSGAVVMQPTVADRWLLDREAALTGQPSGRYALVWPYSFQDRKRYSQQYVQFKGKVSEALSAAAYGLIDLATGKRTRLIDAPSPRWIAGYGDPVWAPDGRSVLVHSLLPVDGDAASRRAGAESRAQWLEVDLVSRSVTPLGVADEWRAVRWGRDGVVLTDTTGAFARIQKQAGGKWGGLRPLGTPAGFNPTYEVATNGEIVIGVKDDLLSAPELAAYDLRSGAVTTLTDLNPELRRRRYGETTVVHWRGPYDSTSFGYLTKPVDYVPGRRYPLVVIWTDQTNRQADRSFVLDGVVQLSGYAIQTLAASGIMVLLLPDCPSTNAVVETPKEVIYQQAHLESGLAELNRLGLIDSTKVAVTGWSRDGFMTNYLIINSSFPFVAASRVDGGSLHYNEGGGRPWRTDELQRVRAALLIESHGPAAAVIDGPMYDALRALGKPVEFLNIDSSPHATTRPLHRWRSLNAHTDWFRFWLQGYEDPDPAKQPMYARWRELRKLQARETAARSP